MKRIIAFIIAAATVLSLSSCIKIERLEVTHAASVTVSDELTPEEDYASKGPHEHFFDPADGDSIKLSVCAFDGCDALGHEKDKSELDDVFAFFADSKAKRREIRSFCDKFLRELTAVPKYDAERDFYDVDSELYEETRSVVEKLATLEEYELFVSDLKDVAYYHFLLNTEKYEELYNIANNFYDDFAVLEGEIKLACYDCSYREYVYTEEDGWTEETLTPYIESLKANAADEYKKLDDDVATISTYIGKITDPANSAQTAPMLEKLVKANNALARYLGYDNYYEYAMSEIYDRDYTLDDIDCFTKYVKEYFTPLLWEYQSRYFAGGSINAEDLSDVTSVYSGSILTEPTAADALDSFLKRFDSVTSVPVFETANDAFRLGRAKFIEKDSGYLTALTDSVDSENLPFMLFSEEYCDANSFVHEFGHYLACVTDSSDSVSYDYCEIQSQANEFLYTRYLEEYMAEHGISGYDYIETMTVYFSILTVVDCCCCNEFEKVLYTGDTGDLTDPEGKFADGITADEYDYLYGRILYDYEIAVDSDCYWKTTVPASPCYYLSYTISLIPAFGIFTKSKDEGFDKAAEAFLSLFEIPSTEGFRGRNVPELEYVSEALGVGSPFDEKTFFDLKMKLWSY